MGKVYVAFDVWPFSTYLDGYLLNKEECNKYRKLWQRRLEKDPWGNGERECAFKSIKLIGRTITNNTIYFRGNGEVNGFIGMAFTNLETALNYKRNLDKPKKMRKYFKTRSNCRG